AHAGRLLHSRPRAAADTGRLPDGRPRPAGYASRQAIGTVARQTSHLKRSPGWKDLRVEDFALKHLAPKHLARLNTWRLNTWGLKTWRLKTWRLSAWHSRSWGLRNASLDRGARAPRDNAMAADLPGTDEERAEAALIAAAGNILRSDNREVPEDFIAALFAHAVPEDLMRYDPRQLAELAAKAWSLLAVRKPGVPKIRLDTPDAAGHERLRNDAVLEIVNDDMPFLVDSVLA